MRRLPTSRTGSAGWVSTACWPGPGPRTEISCTSGGSRSSGTGTSPVHRRCAQSSEATHMNGSMNGSRTVVVKVGSSSLTDPDGAIDNDAIAKLAAEVARVRGDGHHVVVVTSGAIAAGWRTLGRGCRPTLRPGHAAGRRRRRPAPAHAGVDRQLAGLGSDRRPGAVGPARLRPPQPVPPRPPDPRAACSSWASSRWSTRTTPWPTRRSASATTTGWPRWSPTWSAPTCWCC